MRLIFPKTGIFKSGVYHTCIRNANLFSLRAGKIHSILTEKAKKSLTAGDRRDIVAVTCEKGLFSAVRIRCPGGGPLHLRDTGRQRPTIHRDLERLFALFGRWRRQKTGRVRRFLCER